MVDARLFVCARCRCQVWVCSRCDRGQRYCGQACSERARRDSVRAAGARYQRSDKGRARHAARQRRYMARVRAEAVMTHQGGSAAVAASAIVEPAAPALEAVSAGAACGAAESGDATTAQDRSIERSARAFSGQDAGSHGVWMPALAAVSMPRRGAGTVLSSPLAARCARCGRAGRLRREPSGRFDA